MSDFITNTKAKLSYAYSPKRIALSPLAATAITTANTVTTIATHSSAELKSADIINFKYLVTNANAASADEEFEYTVDLGGEQFLITHTTVDAETDDILIEGELVKASATSFLSTIRVTTFSDQDYSAGATTVFCQLLPLEDVTKVAITAENLSTVDATLELTGVGGYITFDKFELA